MAIGEDMTLMMMMMMHMREHVREVRAVSATSPAEGGQLYEAQASDLRIWTLGRVTHVQISVRSEMPSMRRVPAHHAPSAAASSQRDARGRKEMIHGRYSFYRTFQFL